MSDRFVIHSAADLRLLAWSAAEMDNNQDRMLQHKDRYGYPIHWEDYENEESQFGWFIELIDPEGIVKLTDYRLFSAFLHEAKPLKLLRAAFDNLSRFRSQSG